MAFVTVIVTIAIHCLDKVSEKKNIILSRYEGLYNDIFQLRKKVSIMLGYQWYYEISAIENNAAAKDLVRSSINALCNIFVSFYRYRSAKNLLIKLMPPKLFERLIALYPFIAYMRQVSDDSELFQPYCQLLSYCYTNKKFKKRYFDKNKLVWVGIRQSDIQYAKNAIEDSITVFGKTYKSERQNQNVGDVYSPLIDEIYSRNKAQKHELYMFYNPKLAYALNDDVRKKVIGLNSSELLRFLNDKLQTRADLSAKGISCVPSEEVYASDLDFLKLCKHFKTEKLIIQKARGGGGYGTYFLDSTNATVLIDELKKQMTNFLVSPYIEDSVSINVHIVVSEKQTILFPASIQLIEKHNNQLLYRGADFISFRDFDSQVKNSIQIVASKIADILRKKGYRGIAGIDMLVRDKDLYFLEINPRFQASSILLDRFLSERHAQKMQNKEERKMKLINHMASNLVELNKNAFKGFINTDISFYDEINYSCYYYYADSNKPQHINAKLCLLKKADINVDVDGYTENCAINNFSYLFRAIFPSKISQISPNGNLWISDNIKIGCLTDDKLKLKIALLNQGVRISDDITANFKEGVFDAVDFYVENQNFHVNSPKDSKWVMLSPYLISFKNRKFLLSFYNEPISILEIETERIIKNTHERNCLFASTDRLRIVPASGCQYKTDGLGCRFCEVPPFISEYTLNELTCAAEYALTTIKPRHIMIGGGTVKNLANLNKILELARFIKSKIPEMEITLMSVPPQIKDLNAIKKAGITDVSFNIEIFDEELAKHLMPAKSEYTRHYYLEVLTEAVKIWNSYGDVRSIVLVGLESTASLLKGINELKKIGVQPVLSVFRPMKRSALADRLPPPNDYLFNIYNDVSKLLLPTGFLGPKCEVCRNNTLSV